MVKEYIPPSKRNGKNRLFSAKNCDIAAKRHKLSQKYAYKSMLKLALLSIYEMCNFYDVFLFI